MTIVRWTSIAACALTVAVTALAVEPAPPAAKDHPVLKQVDGQLVERQGSSLKPVDADTLSGRTYYALYFSAHWCPPCRAFTPNLVKAFRSLSRKHEDAFTLIFVSFDRSEEDMHKYMREARMPWAAVEWSKARNTDLKRYCGRGIPCLVVLDADGKFVVDGRKMPAAKALEALEALLAKH